MNGVIADIMRIASVDAPTAQVIRDYIDDEGMIDYSECTTREFRIAVEMACLEVL